MNVDCRPNAKARIVIARTHDVSDIEAAVLSETRRDSVNPKLVRKSGTQVPMHKVDSPTRPMILVYEFEVVLVHIDRKFVAFGRIGRLSCVLVRVRRDTSRACSLEPTPKLDSPFAITRSLAPIVGPLRRKGSTRALPHRASFGSNW
jgi:hypothetical protein